MLRARVVTALILLFALLAVLFMLPLAAAAAAFGVVAAVAAWEWAGLMKLDAAGRVFYAVLMAAFCWQVYVLGPSGYLLFWAAASVFWLGIAAPWLGRRWTITANPFVGYGLGVLLIVATWAAMVSLHARSPWMLVAVMAVAWVSDIAAYFTGRAWGRRKLAPSISPGKTWEGVGGALIGVTLYGAAVGAASGEISSASPLTLTVGFAALLALTALGIVGDLFESLLKRQAGIKDSSGILPGHGGVLDRIDSLMAILPPAALLLHWGGR
ncbi:MAG TPA: phosphatidate cytidylyltransferase [Rhodocyclaceae bacterium]